MQILKQCFMVSPTVITLKSYAFIQNHLIWFDFVIFLSTEFEQQFIQRKKAIKHMMMITHSIKRLIAPQSVIFYSSVEIQFMCCTKTV